MSKLTLIFIASFLFGIGPCEDESGEVLHSYEHDITSVENSDEDYQLFKNLIDSYGYQDRVDAVQAIEDNWNASFFAPTIEYMRLITDRRSYKLVNDLLRNKSKERFTDYYDWLEWLWDNDPNYASWFLEYKGDLYKDIDPKFEKYFVGRHDELNIRADEIVWGGVVQDGIPPLRYPKMIPAVDAAYLEDDHVVFGMYINDIPRAYPKRILAWHEFFVDDFLDMTIAGVYCTLCGTVIAYDMEDYSLGTSGFLYRSNKLMYDQATQSLWNTIEGEPVLGPLAGEDIVLNTYPVVTTTWGEWKKQHPLTTVLSLDTGHRRNYDEGEAYREYFSTDRLMFPVPLADTRLKNKEEVLVMRVPGYRSDPLAISTTFLKKKKWVDFKVADHNLVAIADKSGSARAYDIGDLSIDKVKEDIVIDHQGTSWEVTESALVNNDGERLERVSAHNIFWFAWYNAYPDTRLIK